MERTVTYENFPPRLVLLSVLVTAATYALGASILAGFGGIMSAFYLLFCIGHEIHVMKKSCTDCFYFGKWCAFGRGKLAAVLFRQGDPKRFPEKTVSLRDLTSDMLLVIFPLLAGIVLLIRDFSPATAALLALFLALSFGGTYLIRSRVACAGCRQREPGCPAEQFFAKRTG